MKPAISKLIIMLLALCIASVPVIAQQRHRRLRQRASQGSKVEKQESFNNDQTTPEEKAKLLEACALSDSPKPETIIKVPVFCGKAISLPKPPYPAVAKAAKVSGPVTVSAVMDEKGRVVWARAINGHPLLQAAAVRAACAARYSPTLVSGHPVKVETRITYNFVAQ
jgi:TonB family protein